MPEIKDCLACTYCYGIFLVNDMYSVDACCEEHQNMLDVSRPTPRALDECPTCDGGGMRKYKDAPGLWFCYDCKGTGIRQ